MSTTSPLGINLCGMNDWGTEFPFIDLFSRARTWISQRDGAAFGKGPPLNYDNNGYVTNLESGCWTNTYLVGVQTPYKMGNYVLTYEGEGKIEFAYGLKATKETPGRIELNLDLLSPSGKPRNSLVVAIRSTNPNNYIRNMHMVPIEYENTYKTKLFNDNFLNCYKDFSVFRYMDWMNTNNSTVVEYNQLPTEQSLSCTKGVPLEYLIKLSNVTQTDPWICIPHLASDELVDKTAKYIRDNLNPERKVYIEYSNETWNGIFQQSKYVGDKGLALGLHTKHWEAGWRYYSQRSVEIFKIFETTFHGHLGCKCNRLIRVLSTQSTNTYISNVILNHKDAYKNADALAIAPYFGGGFGTSTNASETATWSLDRLYTECLNDIFRVANSVKAQYDVAQSKGLYLIAYEAGQHMVGVNGAENNKELETLFLTMNRDSRMKTLYMNYMNSWKNIGGKLMSIFAGMGPYSKWGSWAIIEDPSKTLAESPKLDACLEFVKNNPKWW